MSRPPYPTYPHQHPQQSQPYIVVHNHDVLCGRGVNISQHPGNERFRALVNTRTDESYCTSFTTGEKRALAEEIVKHIKSLNPSGRFLKRCGRSNSSRGLTGPWEELTQKECIKKACQALRDCNRTDRSGYAAQVNIPKDVKENAEVRASSGLSLKEHAAAAAAKSKPKPVSPAVQRQQKEPDPTPSQKLKAKTGTTPTDDRRKRPSNEVYAANSRCTAKVENDTNEWTKRPRISEIDASKIPAPNAASAPSSNDGIVPTNIHSTPAPYIAPVPVTSTPAYPRYAQMNQTPGFASAEISHPPRGILPPPSLYHHDPHAVSAITANTPYSPAALLAPHEAQAAANGFGHSETDILDLDPSSFSHHDSHFQPFHHHFPSHIRTNSSDMLQAATDAAAALSNDDVAHGNSFPPILGGDDATHDSLGISDF